MPGDFDFDLRSSNLNIGIELEYPGMEPDDKKFVTRGRDTSGIQSQMSRPPREIGGNAVYDGTVGLEVVSDVLDLEDAPQWYAEVIDFVEAEYQTQHQPVGLMENGNTAGLHVHLSPLTDEQARELYEISQTPWAKVLFCSSIANEGDEATWPVFRGGRHCNMEYNSNRYSCVNQRSPDHYEWRLPEPMAPEHLEILVNFLRLFEVDTEEARRYAQAVLDEGDERITSIKRAEATGMDIDVIPTVERDPAPEDPEDFYERVTDDWGLPEIHRVDLAGDSFYVFETRMSGTFEVDGISFADDDVLRADTLEVVNNSAVSNEVQRAFTRRGNDAIRQTEATEELKKIVKKKKGKA